MKKSLFSELRSEALECAQEFADANDIFLDADGAKVIPLSGEWRFVVSFPACTIGGSSTAVSVSIDPVQGNPWTLQIRAPFGSVRHLHFYPHIHERITAIQRRPRSQGQIVSDAVYANWQKAVQCARVCHACWQCPSAAKCWPERKAPQSAQCNYCGSDVKPSL